MNMKRNMKSDKILGLGNDIVSIERIRKSLNQHRERFLSKLFTPSEQAYCLKNRDPVPSFAARFAAKEAIAKALGCGFGKDLSWLDLEILNNPEGKPSVLCSAQLNAKFNSPLLLLSMSHCKEYASAVAIWLAQEIY